jgi:hypothetical protein
VCFMTGGHFETSALGFFCCERMKKGPEYEVKCRGGGAPRESAPRSQSGTLWNHDRVMEETDVLPQVV